MSAKVAYLDPIKSRTNLTVITNSLVSKVIIKNKSAEAVEVLKNNKKQLFYANKEVIIWSGAINSPQILELSGVGNPNVLKKLGIRLTIDF